MTIVSDTGSTNDQYDLNRFLAAQKECYAQVVSELKNGRKRTHWMWYIFPQIDGLAFSSMSRRYAIKNKEEAQAYLNHPLLGTRLQECAEAVMRVEERSIIEIFGSPDDMKLKSCATLFAAVSASGSVFGRILEKYYHGDQDDRTLHLLADTELE